MNAVSPICLVDLAPALRWSKSPDVAPLLHHDRLIDGWWHSLPVARVLDIAGPPWLAHGIARLALEQWAHVPLAEFLPNLRTQPVSCDDLSEPVRGAVVATAGDWERLISASPQEISEWRFPGCGAMDVVSTVAWRSLRPCCELPSGPTPSPALMMEAVRTIAHWLPDSAPEHVRNALDYLNAATGADRDAGASEGAGSDPTPPQTPATRAIRTLRALRARRGENQESEPGTGADDQSVAPTAMVSSAAMIPSSALSSEAVGGDGAQANGTGDLRSQFRSSLLGPGRTLRRPSFGPPKATRPDHVEERPPTPALGQHPLVDLVEEMFRSWPELERTVAAERLFATDPISIRVLSEQIAVDVTEIRAAQRKVEERLLHWLNAPEGAAITKHMRELSEQLGSATTIDRLINAHPDHPVDVPTLHTPLWRVIITLFTDRRMHNGWLIADDPNRLRWQTRELLGDTPSVTEAGIRLGRIGIRQQELRAWLLSTPGVSLRDGHVFVDPSVPMEVPTGHAGHTAPEDPGATTENGLPIRRRMDGQQPSAADPEPEPAHQQRPVYDQGPSFGTAALDPHHVVPLGPAPGQAHGAPPGVPAAHTAPAPPPSRPGASDSAMSARCFRAPDGRWWHRVDITADHLNGAPVAVPDGYATHLGLQPGRLLCLTAPGADLLVLVWRDQPAFDSLRPLLRRQAAQPGDRMFITVAGDRLDARKLPATDLSRYSPAARALHLSGYTAPASTDEALRILSRRITDNDDESFADPQSLIDLLTLRGDNDIAAELRSGLFATH
ncbi:MULTISPECIES: hypothetical protein [Nocardiopsis]|uniref:Uncharacterized protein n=1 Tax=Nocardiopsis sinuspersici TaxID=501010 RepID=A0A1V3C1J4_9ACTN|nr:MULTISPECIES: hypothetical protein [Nocardiopsis]OOC54553.1 hypothetical protein NOSIN_12650 [Nocardiopsis sinuspersici]